MEDASPKEKRRFMQEAVASPQDLISNGEISDG